MKLEGFSLSRVLILIALVVSLALAAARAVNAYTTSNCYGGDLYIDFYDDNGGYHGFLRVRNSSFCQV